MKHRLQRAIAWITRSLVTASVLAVGLVVYVGLVRTGPRGLEEQVERALPRVAVFTPKLTPIQRQWQGYGTVRAYRAADVPARVGSTVLEIPPGIRDGAPVTGGQVLARLDPSDFQRQEEAARFRLEEVQAQLEALEVERERLQVRLTVEQEDVDLAAENLARARQLFERNAETQQNVSTARREMIAAKRALFTTQEAVALFGPRRRQLEATRRALEAERQQAELNLQRSTITSPMDGVVQRLEVDEGENVSLGQRVARVVDLRRIEVPLRLPVAARRSVAVGDSLRIESTSATRQTWLGTVVRIAPENDPASRTVTVFAEFDQETRWDEYSERAGKTVLNPGAFVSGTVQVALDEPRWVVPRRALREGRLQYVDDGVLRSRPVRVDFTIQQEIPKLGLDEDQWAVLHDDLSPLEEVLVSASAVLRDGQPVDVIRVQVITVATPEGDLETVP
jgi:RND family efflux transporter MFP subunit